VKLKMKNLTGTMIQMTILTTNSSSAGGWSKYNSQLDFVKFNFTSQSGFMGGGKHSEKCEKECQSGNFVCIYTVIIKITHFHKSCVV
jgi:hypothetical protein